MLEQEMNAYVANFERGVAISNDGIDFLLLTSQVLLRVCGLTVNDILSLRVSGELALSIATLVRLYVWLWVD